MFKTVAEWLKQEGKATPETNKTDELAALVLSLIHISEPTRPY